MIRLKLLPPLFAALWPFAAAPPAAQTGELLVEARAIRSDRGTVRALAFQSADGFPSDVQRAAGRCSATVSQGTALLRFTGLEVGQTYAVSLFHDENDDRKMNRNWMGIPQEGYGASNDAKATLAPPSFEDARFVFRQSGQRLRVQMRYF